MTYTADNMSRMLGSEATNEDAERFAAHLTARGWELIENSDGQIEAWRDDEAMTEEDWSAELAACFNTTKRISFDNGQTWMTAEEAISEIETSHLWDALVEVMDNATRERVHSELAPCSELEFLRRYLELAAEDLILG